MKYGTVKHFALKIKVKFEVNLTQSDTRINIAYQTIMYIFSNVSKLADVARHLMFGVV